MRLPPRELLRGVIAAHTSRRPEGLGINRGVLNAQDAAWVANRFAQEPEDACAALVEQRNYLYTNFTACMHGMDRRKLKGYDMNNQLQLPSAHKKFTVDSATRYNGYQPP